PVDADGDPVMTVARGVYAGFDPCGLEHAHRSRFEDPRTVGVGDVVAGAVFDDVRVDARILLQVRGPESRRTGTDDRDVCLKFWHSGLLACFVLLSVRPVT